VENPWKRLVPVHWVNPNQAGAKENPRGAGYRTNPTQMHKLFHGNRFGNSLLSTKRVRWAVFTATQFVRTTPPFALGRGTQRDPESSGTCEQPQSAPLAKQSHRKYATRSAAGSFGFQHLRPTRYHSRLFECIGQGVMRPRSGCRRPSRRAGTAGAPAAERSQAALGTGG
jgi:hypothetical protein